jgi:hypothetical protein
METSFNLEPLNVSRDAAAEILILFVVSIPLGRIVLAAGKIWDSGVEPRLANPCKMGQYLAEFFRHRK